MVAFGDPSTARVATLGLNPSRIEFEVDGVELDGDQASLRDAAVARDRVARGCADGNHRARPGALQRLLRWQPVPPLVRPARADPQRGSGLVLRRIGVPSRPVAVGHRSDVERTRRRYPPAPDRRWRTIPRRTAPQRDDRAPPAQRTSRDQWLRHGIRCAAVPGCHGGRRPDYHGVLLGPIREEST